MRRSRSLSLVVAFTIAVSAAAPAILAACEPIPVQEQGPDRGDDLARVQQWRSFLDRAVRAFTAARMSTREVKDKVTEADERIAELQADRANTKVGRTDITGDVGFLQQAQRAFTAAKMSTTDVNRWLEEAQEATKRE
jgi:hypothetical protein